MIKNWKITAHLASPLCGDAPKLDAILAWELSRRLGSKNQKKVTRNVKVNDIDIPPIPVVKKTISGVTLSCCSDPIIETAGKQWQERVAKRFDTSRNAMVLHQSKQKTILMTSGPYKQRFSPVSLRLVSRVVWFARCDKKQVNKLLKSVQSIGKGRGTGYGLVSFFDYEEMENDYSLVALNVNNKVLMKTVPVRVAEHLDCIGHYPSFGAFSLPYWHPENQIEVSVPC